MPGPGQRISTSILTVRPVSREREGAAALRPYRRRTGEPRAFNRKLGNRKLGDLR